MNLTSLPNLPEVVAYIPRVVVALRGMGGVAKASAVKNAIVATMAESGDPFNDTILTSGAIKYQNDIAWARMYLVNAGMLEPVNVAGRGIWKLTQAGWSTPLDSQASASIYNNLTGRANAQFPDTQDAPTEDGLQQELSGTDSWQSQLKSILRNMPAEGFERLCAAIMTANKLFATTVNGHSGDKGIDGEGYLPLDTLELLSIRVAWQCKRYANGTVGSEAVRNFRGSLEHATHHGIIFTTSTFTASAVAEANQPSKKPIKLVDLGDLIQMLHRLELGINVLPISTVNAAFFEAYLHPFVGYEPLPLV